MGIFARTEAGQVFPADTRYGQKLCVLRAFAVQNFNLPSSPRVSLVTCHSLLVTIFYP